MGKPYVSPISPHLFLESEHPFAIYVSIAALSSFLLAKHFNVGFGVGVPVVGLNEGGEVGLLVIGGGVGLPVIGGNVGPSSPEFPLSPPVGGSSSSSCGGWRKNRQVREQVKH